MSTDWRLKRLQDQEYLHGVSFVRKPYRAYRPDWDHDHCVGCWQKLVEPGVAAEDAIHEGYATTDEFERGEDYWWVCPTCFDAFAPAMAWRDVTKRILH